MLILSFLVSLFGPVSEIWYFKDYWRPEIAFPLAIGVGGLEDLIFGFAIGGIAAFGYESLFNKKFSIRKITGKKEWFLFLFFAIMGTSLLIFNNLLKINSIYASSIGMVIFAIIMLLIRPDLIKHAIYSAFIVAIVMFAVYFFAQTIFPAGHYWMTQTWELYGTPQGVVIFRHIPWTEMLWGLSWGFVWGPIYEFLTGVKIFSPKKI